MKKKLLMLLSAIMLASTSAVSQSVVKGDVNNDGKVDVADISNIISIMAGDGYRPWYEIMKFPTREEIDNYNSTSSNRSPYIQAWLDTDIAGNFTEFAIDFRADYLPTGTYCSLASFHIDYSPLEQKGCKVSRYPGISGYAGFQRNHIDPARYNSIISFWDLYCEYDTGEKDTISAKLIKPAGEHESHFGNEGSGVNYLPDYPWRPERWYRMLLQCGKNEATGNTTVEQWVCCLSDNSWKQLCVFDLGVPGLSFKGKTCVFLENFQISSSGEIRTLEFKNARVRSKETRQWINVESAHISLNDNYSVGSYQYGADSSTFWMITTGVPDCAAPQVPLSVSVVNEESGSPYSN